MSHCHHCKRKSQYRSDRYAEYHPRARTKIMGVCAGVAYQFDWDVTVVRILTVVALFTFTAPTFLAYLIAGAIFY